jgi:hypothetical protein
VAGVQQIKTAVCSNQPFPSSTQLVTAMRNLLELDDFWAHGLIQAKIIG